MENYIFFGLSALAIFSALMMLLSKKLVHSLLYLVLCFFAIAGHYLMLNAQFLAMVHIIVYAGAIMVLFLFTIMLLNLNKEEILPKKNIAKIAAVVSGGLLLLALVGVLKGLETNQLIMDSSNQIGLIHNIGDVLFNQYMFPFEAASLLFLAAMVGAVMLVRQDENKVVQ
jgi:NADH-quinone oxidoreductase subunit J